MARKRKKLGDVLLSWGVLDDKRLKEAMKHADTNHRRLGEALIEMGLVDEEQVTKAMATQFDLEYVDLDQHVVDTSALDLMPDDLCLAVPVFWTGILYQDDALEGALRLGRPLDDYAVWLEAMESAARLGTDGEAGGRSLGEMAREALELATHGLLNGAACAGDGAEFASVLDELATYRRLRQ